MSHDRRKVPIGVLKDYLDRCRAWLCVSEGPKIRRRWDRRRRRWVYPDLERDRLVERDASLRPEPPPGGHLGRQEDVRIRVDVGPPGCLVHEVWGQYRHVYAIHWPDGRVERLVGIKEHYDYVAARGGLVWPTFRAAVAAVPLDVGRRLAWDWDDMP